MRNSWKGLVVGGLTGVLAGVVIDLCNKVMERATHGAELARDRAPEAAEWLQSRTHSVTKRAGAWVHDAEVSDRMREAAHRVTESDLATRAGATASKVAEATRERARATMGRS